MTQLKAVFLIGALMSTSCSSVAPVKISAGEQCMRCRRTIVDVRLAGEIVNSNGLVEKFRAPGCMAKYVVAHPPDNAAVYVTDFDSGKMIPAARAVYVSVLLDRSKGESDYRAYRSRAEADAAAIELQTTVVDWAAVLDGAR